jgi:hypothetical protein
LHEATLEVSKLTDERLSGHPLNEEYHNEVELLHKELI